MRLLLAEDEKELSKALTAILKHSHYSVDAVYNGREALEYLASGVYDGVLLDIMMPEVDGITVLKTIRAAGNTVPVLLLTAKSEIDDRVEGLDSGADDYLTKPFAMRELLARIRAMTRKRMERQDFTLAFGNVSLDRSCFEISTQTGSLRLANKEFQILEMLMEHPRQVVSSEQLMEKIWGMDSDTELNTVWVSISNVRKKLSSIQADIRIRAARNLGYFLEEIKR